MLYVESSERATAPLTMDVSSSRVSAKVDEGGSSSPRSWSKSC